MQKVGAASFLVCWISEAQRGGGRESRTSANNQNSYHQWPWLPRRTTVGGGWGHPDRCVLPRKNARFH